jgi:hypothetical protein
MTPCCIHALQDHKQKRGQRQGTLLAPYCARAIQNRHQKGGWSQGSRRAGGMGMGNVEEEENEEIKTVQTGWEFTEYR